MADTKVRGMRSLEAFLSETAIEEEEAVRGPGAVCSESSTKTSWTRHLGRVGACRKRDCPGFRGVVTRT